LCFQSGKKTGRGIRTGRGPNKAVKEKTDGERKQLPFNQRAKKKKERPNGKCGGDRFSQKTLSNRRTTFASKIRT